jgi:hypothetical protein
MADILLAPTRDEIDEHEAKYADLANDLRAKGFGVEIRTPTAKRSLEHAADLIIQVSEFARNHVDEVVIGVITAKLANLKRRPKRRSRRTVAIYGPDGKLLREVQLPDEP